MDADTKKEGGGFGCGFIVAIIIVALIWGIGKSGKYKGETAQQWYEDLDACETSLQDYQGCVETVAPKMVNYCEPDY